MLDVYMMYILKVVCLRCRPEVYYIYIYILYSYIDIQILNAPVWHNVGSFFGVGFGFWFGLLAKEGIGSQTKDPGGIQGETGGGCKSRDPGSVPDLWVCQSGCVVYQYSIYQYVLQVPQIYPRFGLFKPHSVGFHFKPWGLAF